MAHSVGVPSTALDDVVGPDGVVDSAWLGRMLGRDVASAKIRDQDKMGGMSGEIKYVDVALASGEGLALVLKTAGSTPTRVAMGLAREAMFFNEFAPRLASAGVPKSFFATGNMATGEMLLLMECFEDAVPTGVFFGCGNPNNWAIKEKLVDLCAGNPTAEAVAADHFKLYARLHGEFWNDHSLLSKKWLRGTSWMNGDDQAKWESAQSMAVSAWAAITEEREAGTSRLSWDEHLCKCLDASFTKVSWDAFLAEQSAHPFTLVHGDAHPHNALWVDQRTERARLALIDFEMVGVGSPGQEAGQYLISHASPEMRRSSEKELLSIYHTELLATLREHGMDAEAKAYTFEANMAEYVAGGIGRWAWFVPLFVNTWKAPTPVCQFFHDQLAEFLKDHMPDPALTPMPRV